MLPRRVRVERAVDGLVGRVLAFSGRYATLPAQALPGSKGTLTTVVTNHGNSPAKGKIASGPAGMKNWCAMP